MLSWLALFAAENGDPPNPILPELNEAFWATVFFLLIWALMKFVLLPPIRRVMDERDESVRGDYEAADNARDQLEATRREYDAALAGARSQAGALLERARTEAEEHRAELARRADTEIAQMREQASAEIQAARREALQSLESELVELATSAASAVVQAPVDRDRAASAVQRVLAERRN